MFVESRYRGYAALTMTATAAVISGLVAYSSVKLMGLQYGSVGSTTEKMVAQNYALNRAEIIKASSYDNLVDSNKIHDNGLFEDVNVIESINNGAGVKTAKVNIYKDSSKKELVSSMVVKRTNPTAGLADEYKPEGADNTAYNSSVVNKHFATIDDIKHDDRTIGSLTHPVYVKDGNIEEINMENAKESTSRNLLVVNEDGSLGLLKALDFFSGSGLATVSVGTQGTAGQYFTREKGADINLEPYYGQMIIVRDNHNGQGHNREGYFLGKIHDHAHRYLGVNNSEGEGKQYWVRADFGAGNYTLGQTINRLGLDNFNAYSYPEQAYAPYFAIFGDAYDGNTSSGAIQSYRDKAWLLVGTELNKGWPGNSDRYNNYLCKLPFWWNWDYPWTWRYW